MSGSSQFSLLRQRRFAPFFATQFFGALNDNIFRNGLVILITFQGVTIMGMDHTVLANAAAFLFILPFFLFSATAGQFADKYEKSMLMRRIKLLEIGLMSLAAVAFLYQKYSLLLIVLFLMGCQSTLFGPVKYAYLPQKLHTDELVGGNALVESGTYVAIILGLIIGVEAIDFEANRQSVLASILVVAAIAGYITSRSQVRLKFATKDEAVAYAKKQGYMYRIDEPRERPPPRKAYADNFRYTRVGPWTH